MIATGLFTSTVIYCIQVFGNIWGLETHDETTRRFSSFTKEDCHKLQVLQNKVLKLQTGLPRDYPTNELITQTGELSIHQMIAYHTLVQVHKTVITKKPKYLSDKLSPRVPGGVDMFPHRQAFTITVNRELTISRVAFVYRGAKIWNQLPLNLRTCESSRMFKSQVKQWVKSNIGIKPP